MEQLLAILNKTVDYFTRQGVAEPRLQAELLLSGALGLRRLDLYLQFERPLSEQDLARLRPMVKQRAEGRPIQYILGEGYCGDVAVRVDQRVLIPRPETEELVYYLVDGVTPPPELVLELGTGSAIIALALAKAWPEARITATDKAAECLELAAENVARHQLNDRIQLLQSDWWTAVSGKFDLIVSNPPYLTVEEWQSAAAQVREFEPRQALVGGKDGIEDLLAIVGSAARFLNPDGILALETGIAQHGALSECAANSGFQWSCGMSDMQGRPRFFFAGAGGRRVAGA